jgi:hypothetical protein
MRMIERRQRPGLTLEPREALTVRGNRFRKDLQRQIAAEIRIARAIDLAHAAFTKQ